MNKKTKKAFKALLNEKFGLCKHTHTKRSYKATKRAYGDYLYNQDRCYFDVMYQNWLDGKEI